MNQEEIIIKGDNCDTGRTWGRDYLFISSQNNEENKEDLIMDKECMVPLWVQR